jgi:hypothetical protein
MFFFKKENQKAFAFLAGSLWMTPGVAMAVMPVRSCMTDIAFDPGSAHMSNITVLDMLHQRIVTAAAAAGRTVPSYPPAIQAIPNAIQMMQSYASESKNTGYISITVNKPSTEPADPDNNLARARLRAITSLLQLGGLSATRTYLSVSEGAPPQFDTQLANSAAQFPPSAIIAYCKPGPCYCSGVPTSKRNSNGVGETLLDTLN